MHEEITPSLRSSFCSDYYQRSILDSDEDDQENSSLAVPHTFNNNSNNLTDIGSIRSSLLESSNVSRNSSVSVSSNNYMNDFMSNFIKNVNDNLSVNITDNDNDLSLCNDISVNDDHGSVKFCKNDDDVDKNDRPPCLPYSTTV